MTLDELISQLSEDAGIVSDELSALQAIYEPGSLIPLDEKYTSGSTLHLRLSTSLADHDVPISFIVSLPPEYPESKPPQLQLESKYCGDFQVDHELFGQTTRTYMHEDVPWSPGTEALYEGLSIAQQLTQQWYETHVAELASRKPISRTPSPQPSSPPEPQQQQQQEIQLPEGISVISSEPITDRKSVFVGHCASPLTDARQVPQVLAWLNRDKRIARASHNIVAWRYTTLEGLVHHDSDDDGESAAGARLAHLLELIPADNCLVVVSRWFGGIHLGADRFKHINSAARSAIEGAGLLDEGGKGKKKKR